MSSVVAVSAVFSSPGAAADTESASTAADASSTSGDPPSDPVGCCSSSPLSRWFISDWYLVNSALNSCATSAVENRIAKVYIVTDTSNSAEMKVRGRTPAVVVSSIVPSRPALRLRSRRPPTPTTDRCPHWAPARCAGPGSGSRSPSWSSPVASTHGCGCCLCVYCITYDMQQSSIVRISHL